MQQVNANDYRPWQIFSLFNVFDDDDNIVSVKLVGEMPKSGFGVFTAELIEDSPFFILADDKLHIPSENIELDVIGYDLFHDYYVIKYA